MAAAVRPTWPFDLLVADGVDLRPLPLQERKVALARIGKGAEGWIALTSGVVGEGCALYRAAVDADLEGVIAKRLASASHPNSRSEEVGAPARSRNVTFELRATAGAQ